MKNRTYDLLKYVALIALPAATAFFGVIGATFNLPLTQEIITVAVAADAFLGALLGISTAQYNKDK